MFRTTWLGSFVIALAVGTSTQCGGDEDCSPGFEGCECLAGLCFGSLECLSAACVNVGDTSKGPTSNVSGPDGGSETGATSEPTTSSPSEPTTDPTADPTTATDSDSSGSCGDGKIDPGEDCEFNDVNGQTCQSFGYPGGDLYCTQFCMIDVTSCVSNDCGDGIINSGEQCDCGGDGCTPEELGLHVCETFSGPSGPYDGGELGCSPETCTRVFDQCTNCGDGEQVGDEACDGADLGGQSCVKLGFQGGTLSCTADCEFNETKCTGAGVCGDGVCGAGEDSCDCPEDCPNDPNSCSPCECGSSGGACYCDALCVENGDCCANGPC